MPNEFQQPFDKTTRSSDDPELVAGVLGTRAREEMEELADGQEPTSEAHQTEGQFELSADERVDAAEAEKPLDEWRRDKYYAWAKSIGEDEDWVDTTFIFEVDGKVRVEGDLKLIDRGISELPPGLYKVEGQLILNDNNFTKIENIPEAVTQLYLYGNQITKIENIPESVHSLGLGYNQITKIENIPDSVTTLDIRYNQISGVGSIPKSVKWLHLDENPIESLFALGSRMFNTLSIKGIKATTMPLGLRAFAVFLNPSQTELIEHCRIQGIPASTK